MSNIPAKVQTLINKAYLAILDKHPEWDSMLKSITWAMNTRVRKVLGKAHLRSWAIELNYDYCMNGNEESVYNTITHEIAHLVAFRLYNDRGHGRMWKHVHHMLGGTAERLADPKETGFKSKSNRVKRVILEKGGKEYKTTPNRYNRATAAFLRMGYTYRRTIFMNPDGSETIIHSHKEVAAAQIYLDKNLNVVHP